MKKLCALLLGLLVAFPILADEVPDDEAPVEEAPVEEAPPAEAAPVEEAPVEAPPEEAAVEEAPVEEAPAEEVATDEKKHFIYFGAERARVDMLFSDDALRQEFGGQDFHSSFWRGRVGTRVFDFIGLEAQFGVPDDDGTKAGTVEVREYYGFFVVPTATVFDFFEMSVPLGYSQMKLTKGPASRNFDRVAFGLNLELPLRSIVESFPDIRIGGGGMVYQAENDARIYGYHYGLRLDLSF